ncbi:MAG TPA: hypothetical protein ENK83_02420 [Aliiroseovarius sp.]|nr:hypothetical protein [Aliiroseovarius sp.]
MAQNLREDGGYERMRDVLMASYKARKGEEVTEGDFHDTRDREMFTGPDADGTWDQKDVPIPSNLPGKISAVYALIGTGNWREKYDTYLRHAVELAANESDLTTWRKSFLRDAQDTANKLGLGAEFKALLEREGVEYQSTQERQMQHILELLQQRQMEDGDAQAASDDVIG